MMNPCKKCPIYASCDKDPEQLLYCRHVEMLKKIALNKPVTPVRSTPTDQIPFGVQSVSELSNATRPNEEASRN